ncbi:MAG TPA: helix-turn-helix transcriptional regulator [Thermomicrobiales bacterium]|nr:helix-turn-helix transcriptional regulator [Thermomicrobiales bacterium]
MTTAKAEKYRKLREARGISVDELSRRIHYDRAAIERWESGAEEPDERAQRALALAFDVSEDELRHIETRQHHPSGGAG